MKGDRCRVPSLQKVDDFRLLVKEPWLRRALPEKDIKGRDVSPPMGDLRLWTGFPDVYEIGLEDDRRREGLREWASSLLSLYYSERRLIALGNP